MKLSMILARSVDNVIGINNDIPWKCPADMEKFREITSGPGKAVVMGRNTWESLPKKPLPNRMNIVITSDPKSITTFDDNLYVVAGIPIAIAFAQMKNVAELIFIGGKAIYEEAVKIVDEVYLTEMEWNTLSDNVTSPKDQKVYFDHNFTSAAGWDILERYVYQEQDAMKVEDIFEFFHLKRK